MAGFACLGNPGFSPIRYLLVSGELTSDDEFCELKGLFERQKIGVEGRIFSDPFQVETVVDEPFFGFQLGWYVPRKSVQSARVFV